MDFPRPKSRSTSEPALPMINVVFLLLIFFLMSAQISAPPPFDIAPPLAAGPDGAQADHVLFISSEGELAFEQSRGAAVWPGLSTIAASDGSDLLIRADAALSAARLARVLTQLSGLGFKQIRLATVPR